MLNTNKLQLPKQISHRLVDLITCLTKSEKRNFRLMSQKAGRSRLLYLELYDIIDRTQRYEERQILKKLPHIKPSQLSNIKANLYKQILRSLRDIHKESYLEIKAREHFDFAKVLYAKGQYVASLEMLEKVKILARRIQKQPLEYLALSFEKHIESQHVTGSMFSKSTLLATESQIIINGLTVTNKLSNLALLMYGKYLQLGIVRNKSEQDELSDFLKENLPEHDLENLDFYPRLYLYQSYVWYYTMIQDFAKYFQYAQRWVDLFDRYPEMKNIDTTSYIKGLHNVLNSLYLSNKSQRFEESLDRFRRFNEKGEFNMSINEKSQLEIFQNIHILNLIFFKSNYKDTLVDAEKIETQLLTNSEKWDLNRRVTFHYKLACVFFGADNLDKTITHLNFITNNYYPNFKEDIQCFARILKLIAHFDMGDEDLVAYDVRSVYRFLLKMKELQAVQKEILKFIRKTPAIKPEHIIGELSALRSRLAPLEIELLERRPFLYLDIISWLDSKIKQISMADAIRARRTASKSK